MIPPPAQCQMATRAGATVAEAAGSHAIDVSKREAVAALVAKAAKCVAPKWQRPDADEVRRGLHVEDWRLIKGGGIASAPTQPIDPAKAAEGCLPLDQSGPTRTIFPKSPRIGSVSAIASSVPASSSVNEASAA